MHAAGVNSDSKRRKALSRAAAVAAAACLILTFGGCSALKKAGQTIRNIIRPHETAMPAPTDSDTWLEEDETAEPVDTGLWEDTASPEATEEPPAPPISSAAYVDIKTIHGSKNLRDVPVSWQRGTSIIQSEVMALDIGVVMWPVGTESPTMSTETDVDGDGSDDQLWIETDGGSTLRGVFLACGGSTVNLLSLVSDPFWQAVSTAMDGNGAFSEGSVVQADAMDLDGDGRKEIVIAAGDNNAVLAVSVLGYTGGSTLYAEAGGIVGQRLLFVTEEQTLYAPYGNSANGYYVEFAYDRGQFGVAGYNMD